jgi:esterase
MKLYYRELGEGKPLIIQHGVFGSSDNWLTVAKNFAADHKVYLLDARNHGQSPRSDEFNYKVMSDDLMEFIRDHQIENPLIIGHSMGGKIAMRFMADHPAFNAAYIVADISPRYYKRHHDQILEGLNSLDIHSLKSRQEADDKLSAYIPEVFVRQFLLKNLYRNQEGTFDWRINLPVITRDIDNVGEALGDDLKITHPVLFIRGALSDYIKESDKELIQKIFSNVQIATIEGSGHWIQAEKPEEFISDVRAFMAKTGH